MNSVTKSEDRAKDLENLGEKNNQEMSVVIHGIEKSEKKNHEPILEEGRVWRSHKRCVQSTFTEVAFIHMIQFISKYTFEFTSIKCKKLR